MSSTDKQQQGLSPSEALILKPKEALILEALQKSDRPLSAYDQIERLHDQGVASPPTAYRALRRLTEVGLVHRIESLNAFVSCPHANHAAAAAFAICSSCGMVAEFHAEAVRSHLDAWAKDTGFRLERVVMEVSGRCDRCASNDD